MLCDVPASVRREGRENWYRQLGHVPKPGQRRLDEAVDAGYRYFGYFTPPQDGKSFHVAQHLGAYLLLPDVHIWIVAPTYQDGSKEFGYLYQACASLGLLQSARRKHFDIRGGNMHLEWPHGTWVQVISAENPENLRREQLDIAVLAEASKFNANLYDRYLYARVEKRNGLVFAPTTHKGYGWVWDTFAVPSQPFKPKTGDWTAWAPEWQLSCPGCGFFGRVGSKKEAEEARAIHAEAGPTHQARLTETASRTRLHGEPNPDYQPDHWSCQVSYVEDFGEVLHHGEYTPDVIATARRRLPTPMFAEQFGGEAASYAGLVFPFDPACHECEPFDIPPSWTHVVGYDHGAGGGSDPTAILFGSYAPDGTLYLWNEYYDTAQHSIGERAGHLRLLLGGRQPAAIMRGRDAKQVGKELQEVGLFTAYPAESDVIARIIRLTELMRAKKLKAFRGRVPNWRQEIGSYEWDEKNPGAPRDGNDHALEASGYLALAPVSLPPPTAEPVPRTMEQRVEAARIEALWGDLRRARQAAHQRSEGTRLGDILDPNPLAEEQTVVEAYVP